MLLQPSEHALPIMRADYQAMQRTKRLNGRVIFSDS